MAYGLISELIHAASAGTSLISFPTDTVPALASHPSQAELIFKIKQRSIEKPLILMGGCLDDLWPYIQGSEEEKKVWADVAQRYWPGALTLVLPASDRIPVAMNPANPTNLGIRVPNRAIARFILSQTGPLATTSVNRTGDPPLLSSDEINHHFPKVLTLSTEDIEDIEQSLLRDHSIFGRQIEDSPRVAQPLPSTVVKWESRKWVIVRQGSLTFTFP